MFFKWKKTLSLLLLTFILPTNIFAYSDYVIAGGQNIGIELHSKGIIVVGTYEMENQNNNADIIIGDIITQVNDTKVATIEEMTNAIQKNVQNNEVSITYLRGNNEKKTTLKLSKTG